MRKRLFLAVVLFLAAQPTFAALTLAQAKTLADNRLAVIWPTIQGLLNTCVASREDCYTGFSTGVAPIAGTSVPASLCNTLTSASVLCTMNQVDNGMLNSCGVADGSHKFSDLGITLPGTDVFVYRMNTYAGPGGRGYWICVWIQFNGVVYRRCAAIGPQSVVFTEDWKQVYP